MLDVTLGHGWYQLISQLVNVSNNDHHWLWEWKKHLITNKQKPTLEAKKKPPWDFQITLSKINLLDFVPKIFLKRRKYNWPGGWSLGAATGRRATAYSRWMHQHVAWNEESSNDSKLETRGGGERTKRLELPLRSCVRHDGICWWEGVKAHQRLAGHILQVQGVSKHAERLPSLEKRVQYKLQQSSVDLLAFGGGNTERGLEKPYLWFIEIVVGYLLL